MTLTDLLPVRLDLFHRAPRQPKHSAPAEVDRLREKLKWADLRIKTQCVQLEDKDHQHAEAIASLKAEHAEAIARIDERHAEIVRSLEGQIADLERRLDVRVLAEHVVAQTQPIPVITPVPLHEAPFATTNPGRIRPTWAKPDPAA